MDELYLVRRGNEQFWCPPEQVEYWTSQGCTIYSYTPTKIAGDDVEEDDQSDGVQVTITEDTTVAQSAYANGGSDE